LWEAFHCHSEWFHSIVSDEFPHAAQNHLRDPGWAPLPMLNQVNRGENWKAIFDRATGAAELSRFFVDPGYINHFDAAFAAEYGRQWDAHRDARPTAPAWRIAFEAADRERVTATGNLYLALNAHIGRDMPLILARVGLSGPRHADQNMVNIVLYAAMRALMNELAANYDPSLGLDVPGGADELTLYQYVAGLRERAWRLAEQLVAAPTPAARERVQARIEAEAHASALVLRTAFTSPPGGHAAAERDRRRALDERHHGLLAGVHRQPAAERFEGRAQTRPERARS